MAKEIKVPSADEAKAKISSLVYKIRPAHAEINLVPDIKNDAIKAIKLRNLTFFICIVIAAASITTTAIFASIAFGQQAVANGKKDTIASLSSKLSSYSDLNNFLTIKDQLNDLSVISKNKTLLSRAFNILSAVVPSGPDTIIISDFSVNLSSATPTITFDAQANSGQPPYIDYSVLESFEKKVTDFLRYDYGNYVDRSGNKIPAYCIIEHDQNGAVLSDPEKGLYAYWLIMGDGCNPSAEQNSDDEENNTVTTPAALGYETEVYDNQAVVRIWRTPQFSEWYSDSAPSDDSTPYMDLSGKISHVPHFASKCTTYTGIKNSATGLVDWATKNESCILAPSQGEKKGLKITGSSNGRNADGELVLTFSAIISVNPEFFKATNTHMLATAPSGLYNVTDSYMQIQNIFGAPASDCTEDDTLCNNRNGGNNG